MENTKENPNKERPFEALVAVLVDKGLITEAELKIKKDSKKQK